MDVHELAMRLREKNPGLKLNKALDQAEHMLSELQAVPKELRPAKFAELQVPDYNMSQIRELLPGVVNGIGENEKFAVGVGDREKDQPRIAPGPAGRGKKKPRVRLSPTNSERLNRGLVELDFPAFKVHMLLWKWRGAPGPGKLPFFTLKSLIRFCATDRNVIRRSLTELVLKGWIKRNGYNPHEKNELYRLVPIKDVPKPGESAKGAAS
ncbi:hypothetical protein ES703_120373 [subsurface metagenome]